jgi:hypothetical protein
VALDGFTVHVDAVAGGDYERAHSFTVATAASPVRPGV